MQFPIKFNVAASSEKGISKCWESQGESMPFITCCIPTEFGGAGEGYSPEDLFALAILNCIIATFKVYAEKSNLEFENLDSSAELTMDKHTSDDYLFMSHIDIKITITGASDKDKMKTILDRAIKDCAISNSVKTGKTYQININ